MHSSTGTIYCNKSTSLDVPHLLIHGSSPSKRLSLVISLTVLPRRLLMVALLAVVQAGWVESACGLSHRGEQAEANAP